MKKTTYIIVSIVFLFLSLSLSPIITSYKVLNINNNDNSIKPYGSTPLEDFLHNPPDGIIFVLDSSPSISSQEWQGMKNAIKDPLTICFPPDIILGVVQFNNHAEWSIAPRIISEDYTIQDFIQEVNQISRLGGSGTEMYTGVDLARGRASVMIIMTDGNPGSEGPALDACESARLLGQKICIVNYPAEFHGYFPFEDCTNCDGQFQGQPVGRWNYVSNPSEMIHTVSGWFCAEYPEYVIL